MTTALRVSCVDLAVIAIAAVAPAGPRFENDFGGVGQSQQAQNVLTQRFPAQAGDQAQVVFRSCGTDARPGVAARVSQALGRDPARRPR